MGSDFEKLYPGDDTFEAASRRIKAKKVVAVVSDSKENIENIKCLDYGCSVGFMTQYFAEKFGKVYGIDIDEGAIKIAKARNSRRNLEFRITKNEKIPFSDNEFDVVVFNQVYEHVGKPNFSVREIRRVLKPGGVCYFGARNKYFPFDGHYAIPFIALLPKKLANFAMKWLLGKKDYDIKLFSLWELKKLVRAFEIEDYTIKVFANPKKYYLSRYLIFFLPFAYVFYFLVPNYIWILKKSR